MDLTLVASPQARPRHIRPHEVVVTLDDLQAWRRSGRLLRSVWSFRRARYLVHDLAFVHLPLKASFVLRLLARGQCTIEDRHEESEAMDVRWVARAVRRWWRERREMTGFLDDVRIEVDALRAEDRAVPSWNPERHPAYLRTDLVFDVRAGGAVAHTAGVLNALAALGPAPVFLTTAHVPTVTADVHVVEIVPAQRFWDFKELPRLAFTHHFVDAATSTLTSAPPSFLYQRYSTNNYAGVLLRRRFGVPLVLEYNGSEVWIARNWGNPMAHEDLCLAIEELNLATADLIVVVSEVLAREVEDRGVDPRKVLVEPNGVDTERYRPDVDGSAVRQQWSIDEGALTVGFIGTFGRWHGVEVLVTAVDELLDRRPDLRSIVRVLLIGDGLTMPEVRGMVAARHLEDVVTLTGLVPQEEGPSHLAACDVLVAPHVPNPDGSPFFGSPTKLFEYLAMGRPVVASALDQLAEVVEHDRTGWLVTPGDSGALAEGLERLIDDPDLRRRLGEAARSTAEQNHAWTSHARRILDRLSGACP